MKIFYGSSKGRADVPGDSPTEASLDAALAVFRSLDPLAGYMGIELDGRFVVQFATQRRGGIRIELLDTLRPAFDACIADAAFAESLIRAAAEGSDVFGIARSGGDAWEHTDLA